MAKNSLLSEIAERPLAKPATGTMAWHDRLKNVDQELHGAIVEVIDLFNSGEPKVRQKFRSAVDLSCWLSEQLKAKSNVTASPASIQRTIRERASGQT